MPRNGSAAPVLRIPINGVIGALAVQATSTLLEMTDKIATLHAAGTSTVSVSQMALPGASFAAFSR